MCDDEQFELSVNDDSRSWETSSEFAAYDATHFVAGALLAGADSVEIRRLEEGEE